MIDIAVQLATGIAKVYADLDKEDRAAVNQKAGEVRDKVVESLNRSGEQAAELWNKALDKAKIVVPKTLQESDPEPPKV